MPLAGRDDRMDRPHACRPANEDVTGAQFAPVFLSDERMEVTNTKAIYWEAMWMTLNPIFGVSATVAVPVDTPPDHSSML
jgi:hypothetical protein